MTPPFDNSGNGGGVCIHKSNFTMTGGIIGGDENGEANIATKKAEEFSTLEII